MDPHHNGALNSSCNTAAPPCQSGYSLVPAGCHACKPTLLAAHSSCKLDPCSAQRNRNYTTRHNACTARAQLILFMRWCKPLTTHPRHVCKQQHRPWPSMLTTNSMSHSHIVAGWRKTVTDMLLQTVRYYQTNCPAPQPVPRRAHMCKACGLTHRKLCHGPCHGVPCATKTATWPQSTHARLRLHH